MKNTTMQDKLIEAGVAKDLKSEAERRRMATFAARFSPKPYSPSIAVVDDPEPEQEPTPTPIEVKETVTISIPKPEPEPVPEPVPTTHTPFEDHFRSINNQLKDARNSVVFTLEQTKRRIQPAQEEIERLKRHVQNDVESIAKLEKQLKSIDEAIESALLAEQTTAEISSLLIQPRVPRKPHRETVNVAVRRKYTKPSADDPTICRASDVLDFFDRNPHTNWTGPEIREQLPAIKQAHAKKNLSVVLAYIVNNNLGGVTKVGYGVYRKD